MKGEFPCLCFCAGRFEVTNVGEHYNLMEVFAEEAMELKVTQLISKNQLTFSAPYDILLQVSLPKTAGAEWRNVERPAEDDD